MAAMYNSRLRPRHAAAALLAACAAADYGYINVTQSPCFLDNTGTKDVTVALNTCIKNMYGTNGMIPAVPLYFPAGRYLVSDTIVFPQANSGPDDGINVCPARFVPLIAWGSTEQLPVRPVIVLAANSPGFGNAGSAKPVVKLYSDTGIGEGVDMNNIFKGIDVDITAPGNPGAAGVEHNGAQGATVTDVTVTADPGTFACFLGCNGAGGGHFGVTCIGARYGFSINGAQPVPSIVGATLINQTVSAIDFVSQETLSVVGTRIIVPPNPTGAGAIVSYTQSMTLIDVSIECTGPSPGFAGIATPYGVYGRDLYFSGCTTAINQTVVAPLPGAPAGSGQWLHVAEWAKGVDPMPYFHTNVVYLEGQRIDGGMVNLTELLPSGATPPTDLLTRHLWDEASFPSIDSPNTANAKLDCGAKGDNVTDDTLALQACLSTHARVFLPPGLYRISATLDMQPGGALVGMGNGASYILAATTGFPAASEGSPQPLLRTAEDNEGPAAQPTIIAFVGLVTWQHLANVYTLDWRTQHPASVWRVNFESRDCECLWLSAYQQLSPTIIPCSLPVNITMAKSVFRGLGRVYAFVNDDTGAIISTGAKYRSLAVVNTTAFAGPTARLRFYSLNLEHCQSEACSEMFNASWVDVYSLKSEGNLPVMWIRAPATNISVLGLGGGLTAFAYNFTFPSDFAQITPSYFRVDSGTSGVKFAQLTDHGYGAQPPYWPPQHGGCRWKGYYPYPGEFIDTYPFGTWPNYTQWNCWYGERTATAYWHMIQVAGGNGTAFYDKPVYYLT